ncbi:MAG: hypothetical protein ACTSSG_07565 [Candidatus Heimdallarchaeaceae archaeon]
MSIALHNYLKSLKPQSLLDKIADKSQFKELLKHLGLNESWSEKQFVQHLLVSAKNTLDKEKRKEALIILKSVKVLLPLVPEDLHAVFYLTLADSFLLANDYVGAKKALSKANSIAIKLNDSKLKVKVLNRLFIVNRTIGKDKAMSYLLKSRELSIQNNFYENIVFCDVNIGLMHFFKKEINRAIEYCENAINLISEHPYPEKKLLMPVDFFLQIFSENPGAVVVSKNQKLILRGVKIVLQAIKQLTNTYEATRRVSILVNFIKFSDNILGKALPEIENFIETLAVKKRPLFYSAVASGISDYKEFQYSLIFFDKALKNVNLLSDEDQRTIRKGHAYLLANILGISMLYDLESSSQTTQFLSNLSIITEEDCLLGTKNKKISFLNSAKDSDAAVAIKRKVLKEKVVNKMKEQYSIKKIVTKFFFQKAREDVLENLEILVINAQTQNDEIQSLLLAGTHMEEKSVKKGKKIFSAYQIIGHIIPPSIKKYKHKEDFDMTFLYDLIRSPQRFKHIELLTTSEKINVSFKAIV